MSWLGLRADNTRDSDIKNQVQVFLTACLHGDGPAARLVVQPDFQWFHAPVTDAQWEGEGFRNFWKGRRLGETRVLPSELKALWDVDVLSSLVGTPVETDDRLCLIDVHRGDEIATLGVAVRPGKSPVVLAAFDPEPLQDLLRETASSLGDMI